MASPILKYEASAGSGKTYRLALEYLGRLLRAFAAGDKDAQDPRRQRERLGSVLAITFTVKAAREMKERIVQKLKRFALSSRGRALADEDREFLDRLAGETGLDPGRIVKLAGGLIELILASYDDFNVTTIDSLMSAMVKAVSPDLDLPADYEIAVDAGDEMTSRGRAMLASLADDDWGRLEHFLEDLRGMSPGVAWKADEAIVEKVTALFRRTLQQESAGSDLARDDLRRELESSWLNFQGALLPLFRIMDEEPRKNGKCEHVSGTCANARLLKALGETLAGGNGFPGLDALAGSTFFCREEPEALLVKKAPPEYRRRFAAAYRPAQQAWQEAMLAFSAFKTLPYREFLGNFFNHWTNGKKTLFVEEFSRTLAGLFLRWREEAFPYLYMKMSDRFRNFLFDEFQDTSTLQFKALAPLIDEVLSREKKASLFIVGDRKQAIYRWRGGNSELMEEGLLREQVPAIGHLSRGTFSATLGANWRSLREIVDFNNRFWDPEAISRIADDAALQRAIAGNFKDARQELPERPERLGGYVELSLLNAGEEDRGRDAGEGETREEGGGALSAAHLGEIERIIRRLHDEFGYPYSDIAVLVRKNDQVRAMIGHLGRRDRQVPSISDQSLMLAANPRVAEVIAFLRFLDYPPDDLSFLSFVSGAIFQAQARKSYPEEMAAFSEKLFIDCPGPFYKLFQEKFPGAWKGLVEPFFQAVGFLPPYDLFSDFTQAFAVYENFSGDTPFLLALGDALHRAERDGGSSIAGFIRQWRKMEKDETMPTVAIPENAPGVRVLTMHQSKGLEFPAVIVALDDSAGRSDDNLYWDDEGLFYVNGDLAQAHPDLRERYEKENCRGSIDLLNLLYVAFTRAREALFVPVAVSRGIKPPPREGSANARGGLVRKISRASDAVGRHPLLGWFQEDAPSTRRFGALGRRRVGEEGEGTRAQRPAAIPAKKMPTRSWQSRYLVFKKADAGERRDRQGARRGERIHDLLSRIGGIEAPGPLSARVRELAAQAGWPAGDIEALASYLCRDDVFQLLVRGRAVHREKEIVDRSGAQAEFRRLDRLQVSAQEVLVIDFKTGPEKSDEYRAQMKGYLRAVEPLFPGRACRGYLLFIDRGEIEEVPCSS